MSEFKYPHLFEPLRLGNQLCRNRLFGAPTGYRNMTHDSIYPEEAFQYFRRKAMGGCGAVSTGEFIVDSKYGRGNDEQICLDNPASFLPIGKLAFAITRYGAVATAELAHHGMYSNRDLAIFGATSTGEAYGPSECELDGRLIKEMPEELIENMIEKFIDGAVFCKNAGYGMVMLHAGHGWGLHQFLSPTFNKRKDRWGGSIENRARMLIAICEGIKRKCGPKFPIEVRISGSECYDKGYGVEEGVEIAKAIENYIDLLHVSVGTHEIQEVFTITHPSMFLGDGCNVKYAAEIKKHVGIPVATVGALGDPAQMEEIIASGKADVIEMARSLIADPDLPNKIRAGREDEIKVCMRCLNCFSNQQVHGVKYCAVNPESGHEHETLYNMRQQAPRKKVLVVGGGIGGMEAAITCAEYGHEVILCEKKDVLGGSILCEKNVPFKSKLDQYISNQIKAISRAAIDVRMNTTVTKEYADEIRPDVIIAALGARPIKPPIQGIDGKNVIGAEEAYINPEKVGKSCVVLGGGLVGIEMALYMAMLGRKVTVVEMLDSINDGGNILHTLGLKVEIARYGIDMNFKTTAKEITEKGVKCVKEDGSEVFFDAETVIYAVGQRPLQDEALDLRFCAPEFYMIGDCVSPKNIPNATSQAYDISINIGRV